MDLIDFIKNHIKKEMNEVRYVDTSYPNVKKETPLTDNETIRVFHGFNSFGDVENILKNGLSGKQKAKRIYSYEAGNNPYGLFVSVDFNVVKRNFAHSGVIIEFSTKVSDLESPVWVGGRSYYVAGEYTKSFKDMEEREQQRLLNRQKSAESPYDYISKSDRPELADVIFDNPERQALFIGNLNPNMIKAVWYNELLHKNRRTGGQWVRMSTKDFIDSLKIDTKRSKYDLFLPNENFDLDKIVNDIYNGNYNDINFKDFVKYTLNSKNDYGLSGMFFPKQINQIKQMRDNGDFDKYVN